MKHAKSAAASVVMLLALFLTACASSTPSPERQWATARDGVTIAQDTLADLYAADLIGRKEILAADRLIRPARRALAVAEQYLPEGGLTFERWMDVASAALNQLAAQERARLEGAAPAPAAKDVNP